MKDSFKKDNPFPPLPMPISSRQIIKPEASQNSTDTTNSKSFRTGCYLIRYSPVGSQVHYDGTMRVSRDGMNTTASGDLYRHLPSIFPSPFLSSEPAPSAGIPIFPIDRYSYYCRVTQIADFNTVSNQLLISFELHRFHVSTTSWTNESTFTAEMNWTTAPAEYPSNSNYLEGDVQDENGSIVGRLTMGWVSEYLRRAVVEIDRVNQSEGALSNGTSVDWQAAFDEAGWQITIEQSDDDLVEPSGEFWSDAEMHSAMLHRRDSNDLDSEWRYYLICVRRLSSTSRGIMFDAFGTDSNNVPREGAGIASHWIIPNEPKWGTLQGQRFGEADAPYFRTAVHELGHAQGLYHNSNDNGFMNTTGTIAASPGVFPSNILWRHNPADQKRLRHMPDLWVRPGGIAFGSPYTTAPISPADEMGVIDGFDLKVTPLLDVVPLGAPVRVDLQLTNVSSLPLTAPSSMSLRHGHLRGTVIDPHGRARSFQTIVVMMDEDNELLPLGPQATLTHSITLLRGHQGHLFPVAGVHRIIVEVVWEMNNMQASLKSETNVMITPVVDDSHASAALQVMTTPDTLLVLAIGGDHLKKGINAIQVALDDKTLAPHFGFIEAKRLGQRFGSRQPNLEAVCKLLDKNVVMSGAEIEHAAKIIRKASKQVAPSEDVKKTIKMLKKVVKTIKCSKRTIQSVENL